MGKTVSYKLDNGLAIVTVDNPPVNSLTVEMSDELQQVFQDLRGIGTDDPGPDGGPVQAVILTAVPHRGVFIAGADINLFLGLKTRADGVNLARYYHRVIDAIADFDRPVLCAVEGLALGGGTEAALACDIRIAGEKAQFGLTEVTLGVTPGGGGTQRLPRLVGPGYAKKMIFTGERIDAQEAFRIGLVEKLAPEGKALDEAVRMARAIIDNAPTAVKCAKMAVDLGLNTTLPEGLLMEEHALGLVCASGEQLEGAAAFLEKRKPRFSGGLPK